MDCHSNSVRNNLAVVMCSCLIVIRSTCNRCEQKLRRPGLIRFQVSLLFSLFLLSSQVYASFLETLVTPHDFNLSWVTRNAIQNGHRMEVAHFHTNQNPVEVLEYFRQLWSARRGDGIPDFIEENAGKWQIISTISSDKQLVLQVTKGRAGATRLLTQDSRLSSEPELKDDNNQTANSIAVANDETSHENVDGGSSGFISSMELDPVVSVPHHQLPEPAGSTTVSITHSDEAGVLKDDPEQNATTAILVNADSVNSIFRFYRSNMKSAGWSLIAENSSRNAAALMYQRRGRKCEISLVSLDDGQTLITLSYTG